MKSKKTKLYVKGMHCSACEILIEKKLSKVENIESVEADLKSKSIEISSDKQIDIVKLNTQIKKYGYEIVKEKVKSDAKAIEFKNGQMYMNTKKLTNYFIKSLIALFLIIGFFLFVRSDFGSSTLNPESGFGGYFIYGLLAGGSSCAALVGGYIISLSKSWNEVFIDDDSIIKKFIPHIFFHTGRIIGFIMIGLLLGLVGSVIGNILGSLSIFISFFVGILMIIVAFQMFEVEWANKIRISLPKSFGVSMTSEDQVKGYFMPLLSGFFSFLIPCTLTITAFTMVLQVDSPFYGGLFMLAFSLGALVFLGFISIVVVLFNRTPIMTHHFNFVAGILILVFGVYTIDSQIVKINASLENFNIPTIAGFLTPSSTGETTNQSGVQVIKMKVDGIDFVPNTFQVEAGKKVRFVIDGTDATGCTSSLIGKGIFNGQFEVIGKVVETEFTLSKGVHNFSCWMGMAQGQIIAK